MNTATLDYVKICFSDTVGPGSMERICSEITQKTELEMPSLQKLAGQVALGTQAILKAKDLQHLEKDHLSELSDLWTFTDIKQALQRIDQVPGDMGQWGIDIKKNQFKIWKGDSDTTITIRNFSKFSSAELGQLVKMLFMKDVRTVAVRLDVNFFPEGKRRIREMKVWGRLEYIRREFAGRILKTDQFNESRFTTAIYTNYFY